MPHRTFETLSGLRGAAAICVVLFHLNLMSERYDMAPNGALAVDLFFCLSGFVLAHAYGARLAGGLSVRDFMVLRIQRLYPLIVAGALAGGAYLFLKGYMQPENHDPVASAIATVLALLVLPYLNAPHAIGGPAMFPANGPEWSLFFELFINLAWVLAIKRLNMAVVWGVAVVSGVAFVWTGGGGDQISNFLAGFPRVTFSFAAGLIAYDAFRNRRLPWLTLPPLAVIAIAALALLAPESPWDALFEPAFVILIGPLLVLASAQYAGPSRRVMWFGGEISYPIYILQVPVIVWTKGMMKVAGIELPPVAEVTLLVAAVIVVSTIAAFAFDRPVRAYLAGRRRMSAAAAPA